MVTTTLITPPANLQEQLLSVAAKRIYFGHQSVGVNILDGMRDISAESPKASFQIVASDNPASLAGPGLFESPVGHNGDPESKNNAFARALDKGLGAQGGIALFKYCYVDISSTTDVHQLFNRYRETIDQLKTRYPSTKIVHVTVPLTTVEPASKAWVKAMLGRETARAANVRRNEFNDLLRETYRGDALFDLAEIESTHPDGSREFFSSASRAIYTLCPEYTTDGGHLNALGRKMAAEKLIGLLAQI